ncbi:hypothetical protein SPOG_03775 [Schizosaccharomyces cryophilus OY26]|uniref:Uncharacterized protein n=1 Tax=Schizosaccharomyces cryophilus (strain OY26 / ATCC MYA-4695 / CBS 11777 / NBRC 106824 / NRRL Y48691) TaxID=653667 RepID=S9W3Y6_SCHCR|nr:uncharacterized protein SPOG_03775 [Schizosaccharomyces cryophilus OY26]EPY53244.1 hypothetical protein SPOG_03775 [Schizosaccharomyces cryophilus OY26]
MYSLDHYSELINTIGKLEKHGQYGNCWFYYQYINSNSYLDPSNVEDYEWISDLKPSARETSMNFVMFLRL